MWRCPPPAAMQARVAATTCSIVPPRRLSPSIPVDLETIVMTAIAEEPEHRYQTARQLAADLGRFLDAALRGRNLSAPRH